MSQVTVIVAPDKFKGSLSASAVAKELTEGLLATLDGPDPLTVEACPVTDGGDGAVEIMCWAAGFAPVPVQVVDALGRPRTAMIAVKDRRAVIELAEVCGLTTGLDGRIDPMRATSTGLGLAIAAALDMGCRELVVGLGGSASTDGGAGMLVALGARLLDADGRTVDPAPEDLADVTRVDLDGLDARLQQTELIFAADVTSPLLGPDGAAHVFGPQKGATPAQVDLLEAAMRHWASLFADLDPATSRSGAAGGTGFGALVLGADLVDGADHFLGLTGFGDLLTSADLVITGEGRLDRQTLQGKVPGVVVDRARAAGVPAAAVVGVVGDDVTEAELSASGLSVVYRLSDHAAGTATDPDLTAELLRSIGRRIQHDLVNTPLFA